MYSFFFRMMGRLLCPEKSEPGRKAEDTSSYHPSHAHPMSTNIPLQQQNAAVFPPISPVYLRPLSLNPRTVSSFADMPPLQERSHSSFQVMFTLTIITQIKVLFLIFSSNTLVFCGNKILDNTFICILTKKFN